MSILSTIGQMISRTFGSSPEANRSRAALPDLEALARTGVRVEIRFSNEDPTKELTPPPGTESHARCDRIITIFQYNTNDLPHLLTSIPELRELHRDLLANKLLLQSVVAQSEGFLTAAIRLLELRSHLGIKAFEQMRDNLGRGESIVHAYLMCGENIGELARRFASTKFDPQDYPLSSVRHLIGLGWEGDFPKIG